MPTLKDKPLLKDFQKYVVELELEVERGFAQQNVKDKCLLLGEEVGELFKAVRKEEGMTIDSSLMLEKSVMRLPMYLSISVQ